MILKCKKEESLIFMNKNYNYLINWIKDNVKAAKADGVVIALSGGIDSAVVSTLAKKAFPNNTLVVWMGIDSSKTSRRNALRHINDQNLEAIDLDLKVSYEQIINQVNDSLKSETENIEIANMNTKARLRMLTIYHIARVKNYLVLGTSNLDEIYMGYFTKWGDGSADLYPIANLHKSEVYELANELEINQRIINAKPSADLYAGQEDELDMGVTYKEIEAFIKGEPINNESKTIIERYHQNATHKDFSSIIKKPKGN